MTTIQFHLRPSTRGREFEDSLFVRVIHGRKALSVTTSFRLYPSEWDEKHYCVIYRPENSFRFLYLSGVERMMVVEKELLGSIISSLEEQGEFGVGDIVRLYRLRKSGVPMLPFVEKLSGHLIDCGQYRTARAYGTASRGLARFSGKECLTLSDICPSLLRRFEADMLEKGKTLNTVSFYMRNLRAIYNRAVRERLIEQPKENPFEGVYTGVEQTRKRALSREVMTLLNNILTAPLNPPKGWTSSKDSFTGKPTLSAMGGSLQVPLSGGVRGAGLLFLFSFHARGMSFVDIAFLKKSDIRHNILTYRRRKTGQQLEILVTPEMRRIMDSFQDETKFSPYVFPVINKPGINEYRQYETGLKRQNRWLKRVATLALKQLTVDSGELTVESKNKPNKELSIVSGRKPDNFQLSTLHCQLAKLSTHVARHTWASLAKELNYPLAVISEALGHSSEKTTSIYLSSFDRRVLDDMNRSILRAVKKVG